MKKTSAGERRAFLDELACKLGRLAGLDLDLDAGLLGEGLRQEIDRLLVLRRIERQRQARDGVAAKTRSAARAAVVAKAARGPRRGTMSNEWRHGRSPRAVGARCVPSRCRRSCPCLDSSPSVGRKAGKISALRSQWFQFRSVLNRGRREGPEPRPEEPGEYRGVSKDGPGGAGVADQTSFETPRLRRRRIQDEGVAVTAASACGRAA